MSNYIDLSVTELHTLLKEKKIKPIDLVNEALEKIEKNKLNDYITINENAREEAIALENTEIDNIFWGIPIAIKDNIITKDLRTTCASKMLDDFIPIYDATVIEKIKAKHMIIIGKTNMDEFAMGSTGETSYYGKTLNPWNKNKVPGNCTRLFFNFSKFTVGPPTQNGRSKGQGTYQSTKTKITFIIIPSTPSIKIILYTSISFFSIKYFSIACFVEKKRSHNNNKEKSSTNKYGSSLNSSTVNQTLNPRTI